MFSFLKKSHNSDALHLNVTTDIHSHILPGLDDGSKNIESSLELIRGLYNLGIRKTIATPHIIGDIYRNNPDTINKALTTLRSACISENIDIEINAAAEYMLDDYFMNLLKEKTPLLTISKNFLLTEMPYTGPLVNLEEVAFEIMTAGYIPIMAHPERYFYYHRQYDNFARLKELGFLLQVNLLSLTGYYGSPVAKAAKYIFENDLADFVGTDMHHTKHLSALFQKENLNVIHKYLGQRNYNKEFGD